MGRAAALQVRKYRPPSTRDSWLLRLHRHSSGAQKQGNSQRTIKKGDSKRTIAGSLRHCMCLCLVGGPCMIRNMHFASSSDWLSRACCICFMNAYRLMLACFVLFAGAVTETETEQTLTGQELRELVVAKWRAARAGSWLITTRTMSRKSLFLSATPHRAPSLSGESPSTPAS
jgi:hypothetical protein